MCGMLWLEVESSFGCVKGIFLIGIGVLRATRVWVLERSCYLVGVGWTFGVF